MGRAANRRRHGASSLVVLLALATWSTAVRADDATAPASSASSSVASPPVNPGTERDFVPIPDRWRIEFPEWQRYPGQTSGESPYEKGSLLDPYHQNVLKGDYPILGQDIFLNLTLQSDTILEGRTFPIPSGVSTAEPRRQDFFGNFNQLFLNQNFVISTELFQGDAGFKPKDWVLKATPVFNINYLDAFEKNLVNIDVRAGTDRVDGYVGFQELFGEYHLANISDSYDFLTVIAGIQPFNADFRGFLYNDNNLGVRLQGNYASNRLQWNLAWFRQLEKDTNSGLNTYDDRGQNVFIANFFCQDFGSELSDKFLGYTLELSYAYNLDDSGVHYDKDGFLVRPANIGFVASEDGHLRAKKVGVSYLGLGGEGHIGPINVSHQYYLAVGSESQNEITGQHEDVLAHFFAAEASIDVDWVRFKASFLWASGDRNPNSKWATGFDSIFDNPFFAGAGFSYYDRQNIPLSQTGVNLKNRLSLLPDLRSSKIEGEANFVNPGLLLGNLGVSLRVTPKIFIDLNVNALEFDRTEVLEKVLVQSKIGKFMGIDYNVGVQYRPLLKDNVILTVGAGALTPGQAFRNIYDGQTLYSTFASLTLTY